MDMILTADGMSYPLNDQKVFNGPMAGATAIPVGPLREGLVNSVLDGRRTARYENGVVAFSESTATLDQRSVKVGWRVAFVINSVEDLSDYVVWAGDVSDFHALDVDSVLAAFERPDPVDDQAMEFVTLETFSETVDVQQNKPPRTSSWGWEQPRRKKEDDYPKGYRPPAKKVEQTSRPTPYEPARSFAESSRRVRVSRELDALDVSMC